MSESMFIGVLTQQKAISGTLTVTNSGTIDVSNYKNVLIRTGTLRSLVGTETDDGETFTISSPGVSKSGWINTDNRTYKVGSATFTTSGENIVVDTAGYVKSGKVVGSASTIKYNDYY